MLTVALATFNEELNIGECLESVKDIADEIVIVDGSSSDKTVEIANKYHAKVLVTTNPPIFHVNKQKALDMAKGEWILNLDADERVTSDLAHEIKNVIQMSDEEIRGYEDKLPSIDLFIRHQKILEKRDGLQETKGEFAGFFIPRLNYFLGRYLRYGGVYPDGVIRLVKKGKAHYPAKDVHEQIVVEGKIGWLEYPLYHRDSPTFARYLARNNRYIALLAQEFQEKKVRKDPITFLWYVVWKPVWWFGLTYFRHKGFLDSWQGLLFSVFSARRFAVAYLRYIAL